MGEAVLAAYRRQPQQLRPFIDRACQFSLDQLHGAPEAARLEDAVRARNDLLLAAREIVADHPKEPHTGNPS